MDMTTNQPTPTQARSALDAIGAAPRPRKAVPALVLVLASASFIPAFLATGRMSVHGGQFEPAPFVLGMVVSLAMAATAIALAFGQRRVARGWSVSYVVAMVVSSAVYVVYTLLATHHHYSWRTIAFMAALMLIAPYVSALSFLTADANRRQARR